MATNNFNVFVKIKTKTKECIKAEKAKDPRADYNKGHESERTERLLQQ